MARDAEWSITLLSLAGRAGLDLGLGLSYSGMVWTASGPYIYFDEDRGWPSPGFRLGFPTVQEVFFDAQVGVNAYLLITAGGHRVGLRQVGASNIYEAADASHLQLTDNGGSLLVRPTDGRQMTYTKFESEWRCTQIEDRNGNYLTVNYDWLGQITTITDTLGRIISFNYDGNANLNSISQTWTTDGVSQTHQWATFRWGVQTIQSSFSGVSVSGGPNGTAFPVLTQVGLDDGSHYTFEYTNALQVSIIRRFALDMDTTARAYTIYDYEPAPTSDCPRLTGTRVAAENWTGVNGVPAEVSTQYSRPGDGSCTITAPDGTVYKVFYGTGWQKGLTVQSEIWSGGVRQKWTTSTWTQDNTGVNYELNPRVIETNVNDASGNRRRTTIDYGPYEQYGLPYLVRDYAADGVTEIRQTYTDYNLSQQYLDRRIIGLPWMVHISNTVWWQSKVVYSYDDPTQIQSTPANAVQHDASFGTSFLARGNMTSVARWDTTDGGTINDPARALTSRAGYDIDGSAVWSSDPSGQQSNISYADSFSDGNNSRSTFAYPTTLTDADGFSSYLQYNFDFGARTKAQGPPPAGQTQGVIQTFGYDAAARIQQVTTTNNGAYTRYVHGPNYVESFSTVNTVADEAYSIRVFDGAGRVIGQAAGSAGGFRAQLTLYDLMGRAVKQSNPTETSGTAPNWPVAGDDDPANGGYGWLYTQQTYDWKGRVLTTYNQDGTYKTASYTGCGCAGGEVVTLTDEVGRQQKVYSDVLGRQWKTEILNTNGTVYSTTTNTLNARDQITLVRQWAGAENGGGAYQDTTMTYDAYGRLATKHVPEQNAGTATVYAYNNDDTINSVTDARGASATYSYNSRHLVTAINYAAPAGITPTAPVSYSYDAAGNRTSMTDGPGSVSYSYDSLSRMSSETRTFNITGRAYSLSYGYNLAGEVTSVTDPFGGQVSYGRDAAGRMSSVTGVGTVLSSYVSGFSYRAWGAVKHMTYGNNMTYDVGYNSRLLPATFAFSGANVDPSRTMNASFEYYSDGRVRSARDLVDNHFDRAYSYDHAGRLAEAYTNQEARDFLAGVTSAGNDQGPYRESFAFDSNGNTTSRAARVWSQPQDVLNVTYDAGTNRNTNPSWRYDAEGNVTKADDFYTVYDAAGRPTKLTPFPPDTTATVTSHYVVLHYDGDGNVVRREEPDGFGHDYRNSYNIRSTALGGQEIAQDVVMTQYQYPDALIYVDRSFYRFVSADGELIARDWVDYYPYSSFAYGSCLSHNPVTGSSRGFDQYGHPFEGQSEPDAAGFNVGMSDPAQSGNSPDDAGTPAVKDFELGEQCNINGITMNCGNIGLLISSGSAFECPLCGSSTTVIYHGKLTLAFFNAFADGYQGFVPVTARYIGNGNFTSLNGPPSLRAGSHVRDTDFWRLNGATDNEAQLGRTPEVSFMNISLGTLTPQNSNGQQLSPCLRDALRQYFPQQSAQGKNYSPVDDARFISGLPTSIKLASAVGLISDPAAVTYGLYDINYDPSQVSLSGGSSDALQTIIEELSHTVQFIKVWSGLKPNPWAEHLGGQNLTEYKYAVDAWETNYAISAAAGKARNGDSYKNNIEKEAKNRTFDIMQALMSDQNLMKAGNVCGFDLTNVYLKRPDY